MVLDKWLKAFGGARQAGSVAARRLEGYPAYLAPHPGPGRHLTVSQAQENLDYLLSNRAERLGILTRFLQGSGVDIAGVAPGEDCRPLLRMIHQWAAREWPSFYDPSIAKTEVWLASTRTGPQIVYSLLMDVAILFGELIVTRRPQYRWSLDLDRVNKADEMISYNRPVVQIPQGGPFPAPIMIDVEGIVVGHFIHCRQPLFARVDELTRAVTEAISGAHEAYWLQQQQAAPRGEPPR